MDFLGRCIHPAALLFWAVFSVWNPGLSVAQPAGAPAQDGPEHRPVELGRRMYLEGVLPSGEIMTATVQGDIKLSGDQVVCGACHRRSGMGSSEGQEVVPAVTGEILFNPVRLPTSKPPLAPELRPAYTDAGVKRAIRDGVGASGDEFSPFMPRYALSDEDLDNLIAYLKTLSMGPAPGVTDKEIHFATIVADSVDPGTRKALVDLLNVYVEQKNVETRNESQRAAHAPWHKEWIFGPYRKWVLHVWELKGPRESWTAQLEAQYDEQPVFAVLSGIAPGNWQPVHDFCERSQVPCLFPITDLPVIDEQDFYTVYLSEGMTLEGEAIARHLADDGILFRPTIQVYRDGDPLGETAAAALRASVAKRGAEIKDLPLGAADEPTGEFWQSVLTEGRETTLVMWLGKADLGALWPLLETKENPERLYLSTTVFGTDAKGIPEAAVERVFFVHPSEMPNKTNRLLLRSTGWLRAKRIYSPEHRRVQADAYFALKIAGGAVQGIRGYFIRDYFLERIEHMVDNAPYTSVYPRISLAPGQRFVAKGWYIARISGDGKGSLEPVTDWTTP